MLTYSYQVGDSSGKTIDGRLEAQDEKEAIEKLKNQGYFILKLRRTDSEGFSIVDIKDKIFGSLGPELSGLEKVMFTINLAELLKTGLPIVEAIQTFEEQEGGSSRTKKMIGEIIADIRAGKPPSQAFAKFPKTFPQTYTAIVSSGETIGTLGETLSYLGIQLKKDFELKSRVRGAFTYPIVVLVVMLIVTLFILFFVVPKITAFAANLGTELPLATRILIDGSRFAINNFPFIIGGTVIAFILFLRLIHLEAGKKVIDKLFLRLPIFGSLVKKYNLAQFARLLGAFYHYGVSLPQAFDMLGNSMGNYYYRQATISIKNSISRGLTLSEALTREEKELFPSIVVRMLRGAEKSAKVDEALWRFAEYYENDLENNLKNMTTIIEPILIVVLGIGIVGLAMAVVVPIYKVSTSVR